MARRTTRSEHEAVEGTRRASSGNTRPGPQLRPSTSSAAGIRSLQSRVGNAVTARLVAGGAQPKLQVGPAHDKFEQEADKVADEVMQRRFTPAAATTGIGDGIGEGIGEDSLRVSRAPAHDPHAPVGLEGGELDAGFEQEVRGARSGGQSLPTGIKSSMEGALDADFGGVRLHTGSQADTLNRGMQSKAFTLGNDIFFAKGQFQPASTSGQHLLAHELTHTLQQGTSAQRRSAPRSPSAVRRSVTDRLV